VIVLKELDPSNLEDVNKCHDGFLVASKLVLSAVDGEIGFTVAPVTQYEKHYPPNEVDYSAYMQAADQNVFLAYVDDEIAGELVIRQWWNNFGYIEDLSVRGKFRRQGVGQALVERALSWANSRRLPGVMLETQNDNVGACRLYERCGFKLGGFDQYLYRALRPDSGEVALFWYYLMQPQ
jgi:streptothricin acetyltransferase